MALDGGAQHFGVNLCGLDVLVPKHTSHILYRHIVSQCHRSEGVASHVESQLLPEVQLHLYHMKVVVGFLVAYLRKLIVVLLKHLHRRREDRREELRIGLDTATIDVVHLALLLRHAL